MIGPKLRCILRTVWCTLFSTLHLSASAGEFSVNPIRVDLSAAVRSGVVSLKNEDTQKLNFQLQAMTWSQDADGKDVHTETQDLVFFPRILSVEPGEEGVIRVGSKGSALQLEKTYRLFIEELPGAVKTPDGSAAQINVLIRFGAPVFVAPLKPEDGLDIERFMVSKGIMTITARNSGNRHQLVQGIGLKGTDSASKEIYGLTLGDRYLLAGTVKSYTTTLTPAVCTRLSNLEFEFKTDKVLTSRKLNVTREMCN